MNAKEKKSVSKICRWPCELQGVVVDFRKKKIVVSIVSPTSEADSYEIKVKDSVILPEALKMGTWVIVYVSKPNVYQIVRQCKELLPTYIHRELVLLKTTVHFQAKGEKGYRRWVRAPLLGRVMAVIHEQYNAKQTYFALVARRTAVFKAFVKHCWILTKYVVQIESQIPFETVCHFALILVSYVINLLIADDHSPVNSDDVQKFRNQISEMKEEDHLAGCIISQNVGQVQQETVTNSVGMKNLKSISNNDVSTDFIAHDIIFFHGVVSVLNDSLVVAGSHGQIGYLKHMQCGNSSEPVKVGDWLSVAVELKSGSDRCYVYESPSLIAAKGITSVRNNIVQSKIEVSNVEGDTFYGISPIFGKVIGNATLIGEKIECVAWCTPRASSNFHLNWQAVEIVETSHTLSQKDGLHVKHKMDSRSKTEVSCTDAGRQCHQEMKSHIYDAITKVVSNPVVREAMQKYRPKELESICETLGLKF
ncbi:unnamed protein product [Thelazia callipaeda]|uniref:rRNA biogenesis protein RRP5 n=1 Tax=Thelazia callipaeda TaxID=103827 RepID=A0A0N5D771_THECL|nr:unnamed protein product [Thelazia callipaeda]